PRFHVVPGKIIYLGTLALRSPSDSQIGSLDILNDYLIEKQHLYARYQTVATNEPPLEGLMYVLPPNETGGMFLDIIVNNHLLKPFLIDTGATLTVITRQTARELGISDWWTFPRKEFLTGGGRIEFPVSQVASIQVGNNVVKDVEVAIDVDEHFPYGLLGMNVLQHFQVVLDKKRQQVRLIP
ncbi:MAG TPA: retropepsin-like aspartic protease, partial [Nitrospirales bacterium]|nr:retropepsin-like aspartic protease [Nitrospirales bacterium]